MFCREHVYCQKALSVLSPRPLPTWPVFFLLLFMLVPRTFQTSDIPPPSDPCSFCILSQLGFAIVAAATFLPRHHSFDVGMARL